MKLLVLSVVTLSVATGCNEKKDGQSQTATPQQQAQPATAPSQIVVPDSVKGKWKAVKIQVADKSGGRQHIYTIPIGTDFKLPGSDLTLRVESFLPNFVMEGTTLTSGSNELRNPAARLMVKEGGREIFRGWLFSLYPTTHSFQHPQYGFTLVDYIPAEG